MAPQKRLIDNVPDKKDALPMKVLILGMPRTGIISLRSALGKVGFKCFHGQMMDIYPEMYPLWEEALGAVHLGRCERYGRREYDKLLGNFDVSSNFPGTLVAEDLIKAYPEAKVILTTRDADSWLVSMKNSVDAGFQWKSFDWIAPWEPKVIGPWWKYHNFQHSLREVMAPKGECQAYLDHYELVRKLVPADRLLNYRVGEGWETLCDFLEIPVPDFPFPHVNNTNQFLEGRAKRWWRALGAVIRRIGLPIVIAGAGSWCLWKNRLPIMRMQLSLRGI